MTHDYKIVERFFRDLTAIGDYIDHHNVNPKPLIWTAKASGILEKLSRAHAALYK